MASIEHEFLHDQLTERRERLQAAIARSGETTELERLMHEVDSALERMGKGTYGLCETCHDPIEKERLIADPLVCYCLDHLTFEQRRALESDLELAARIQSALLPPQGLNRDGWHVHYHYEPAGLVSGDYCDVILPEGSSGDLFFLLGDVSGKGVAASMLMTQLHAMFRSLVSVGLPVEQLMARANRLFCETTITGQYATLVCGKASPSGEVEISNAGHCPTLVVSGKEAAQIESTGFPLGMFCNSEYAVKKLQLAPGGSLVLYTDGVYEARDRSHAEYGIERLVRFISERHALAPQALTTACLQDVKGFLAGAPKHDDLTIMVLRRTK